VAAQSTITDPKLKTAYDRLMGYSNIPRKEKKFINFARNSLNIRDDAFLKRLWEHFGGAKPGPAVTPSPAAGAAAASGESLAVREERAPPAGTKITATQSTPKLIDQIDRKRKAVDGAADDSSSTPSKKKKKKKKGEDKADLSVASGKLEKKKSKKSKKSEKSKVDSTEETESEDRTAAKAWLKKKLKKLETTPDKSEREAMIAKRLIKIRKQRAE
jgi:hypothetical protein